MRHHDPAVVAAGARNAVPHGLGPISLENASSAAAARRGTYRGSNEARAQVTELHSVLERLQPLVVRSLAQESGHPLLSVVPLTMRSRFYPVPLAAEAPFRLSVYARCEPMARVRH